MTKDEELAMDLALEAVEKLQWSLEQADCSTGYCCCGSSVDGHTFGDGHSPVDEGEYYQSNALEYARKAINAIKQARALDKKAENARELGLDYEPHKGLSEHLAQATNGRVRIDPVTGDVGIGTPPAAQPAPVQEPVFCEYCGGNDDADFGLPTDHCTDCARPQPAAQPAPVQDKVTLIQTNVGIGNRAMEAYEAAKERDRADRSAPVQEPVAWMYEDMMGLVGVRVQKEKPIVARPVTPLCLCTAPAAQRQWVGLSSADRGECLSAGDAHGWIGVMEATEAKLKEKNNG